MLELNPIQSRVLGVLIEKCFTTPDQYPLTVNSSVAACNQKSNRDPVLTLTEHEVVNAIQELVRMGLVAQADSVGGARAVRYQHTVPSRCGWSAREQAVLTELLLRGPQTVGELRTRADRMVKMSDLAFVQGVLDELADRDTPLVRSLPREPGRSAVRYTHTFGTDRGSPPPSAAAAPTHPGASPEPEIPALPSGSPPEAPAPDVTDLVRRLNELESRVTDVESTIQRLLQ